jgi:hypothetical protein
VLEEVGNWMNKYSECVYDTEVFDFDSQEHGDHRGDWSHYGPLTSKGNNLYFWVKHWVGTTLVLVGLESKVKNVCSLSSGDSFKFEQTDGKLTILDLPDAAPNSICTVLKIECDTSPSMYLCGGMQIPKVKHPHYDPCESDIA